MRQHDERCEDRIGQAASRLRRANDARGHEPAWEGQNGDIDLCVQIGREALNRAPEIKARYEALDTALADLQALPGGAAVAGAVEEAATNLQLASVELAAAVAVAAAQKLNVERLYAEAVWSLSTEHGLMSWKGDEMTLTEPYTLEPPTPAPGTTPEPPRFQRRRPKTSAT